MATINSKEIIDRIIEHNGEEYHDEPPVNKIVEYKNQYGKITWGVVWNHEPNQEKYDFETEFIKNPKIIFERKR